MRSIDGISVFVFWLAVLHSSMNSVESNLQSDLKCSLAFRLDFVPIQFLFCSWFIPRFWLPTATRTEKTPQPPRLRLGASLSSQKSCPFPQLHALALVLSYEVVQCGEETLAKPFAPLKTCENPVFACPDLHGPRRIVRYVVNANR
jgi:hypothetical protein